MQTHSMTAGAMTCPYRRQSSSTQTVAPPVGLDAMLPPAEAIARWLTSRNADDFPYDAAVAEFHRVGKHLVPAPLLEALAGVRAALPEVRGSAASVRLLERLLDTALDKWDGRYANPTYLALILLPLPTVDDCDLHITAAARQYDRLLVQLITDASRFEIAAMEGATELLPQMRPDVRTTAKRCRLGLQIAGPAAQRLGLSDGVDVAEPIAAARRLWERVTADLTPTERRTLQLSMLPVSLVHDEYQFIRVLQSFEATFALVAVQLHAAVRALADGETDRALACVNAAEVTLHEAAPLFSLVATMQVAAFHTFREFTEGASAVQSRNYKLVESLCQRPEPARLDSAAYRSVPEVRQRVLDGQMTLDGALAAARAAGRLSARDVEEMAEAMRQFAETLLRWRRAHYRIAVRMLGERTGTGYTEGATYLKAAMAIAVFSSLTPGQDADTPEFERGNEIATVQTPQVIATRGRCPFAA